MAVFLEPFTAALAGTFTRIQGASGALAVATGGVQGTAPGSFTSLTFRLEHDSGSSDMFAEVELPAAFGDQDRSIGVATRVGTGATFTGYLFDVNDQNNRYRFGYFNAGSYNNISGFVATPVTPPTKMRLESQGSTHQLYLGSWTDEASKPAPLATYTDATIAAGSRGALDFYNANSVARVDNFRVGSIADLSPPPVDTTRFFLGCA